MRLLHCKWAPWKLSGYLSDCIILARAKCQLKGRAQRFCTGSCIQSVTALIRLRYRLYFRQITWFDDEKRNTDCVAFAWKSIYSVSSTVITIHLEKNCFQASKCVRMRNSTDAYPSLSDPPGVDLTTLRYIWRKCLLILKQQSLDSVSNLL